MGNPRSSSLLLAAATLLLPPLEAGSLSTGDSTAYSAVINFDRADYYVDKRFVEKSTSTASMARLETNILFNPLSPDAAGNITLPTNFADQVARMKAGSPAAAYTLGVGSLTAIVGNSTAQANFNAQLQTIVTAHGFGCIDLDWEDMPNAPATSAADYAATVKAVSDVFRPQGIVVSTSHAQGDQYKTYVQAVKGSVDFVNLQFYYASNNAMDLASFKAQLADYVTSTGIAASQLRIGLPSYAMVNPGVTATSDKWRSWDQLIAKGADVVNGTTFTDTNGETYYYSGLSLIRQKIDYAKANGFAGVFTWELTQDGNYPGTNSINRAIDERALDALPSLELNNANNGIGALGTGTVTLGAGAVLDNGVLRFARSAAATHDNRIDGSGSVEVTGTGAVTLTGASTYTGGTTIASGASLLVGANGSSGAIGSGTVVNNGILALYRSDAVTLDNRIDGSGSVQVTGIGPVTLTGANTFTGGTTIASGASLLVGANGSTGAIGSGAILNNGTFSLYRSDAVTLDNTISGTGAFRKRGAGTLLLTGANSHTGSTTLLGGVTSVTRLADGGAASSIGASSNLAGNLLFNGGALAYVGTTAATTDRNFTMIASARIENNATSAANTLAFTGSGTIAFSGSIATALTLGGTNTGANIFALKLSDNGATTVGLVKQDAGTWSLTAANTYTGPTTVSAGKLALSGSLTSHVTATAGTLAPTGAPSTTGNIAINSGGRFAVRINGPAVGSQYDQLTGGGTVTLAGELDITASSGLTAGTSFTILNKTSAGAVSDTFAGKANGSAFASGGYTWLINYAGGDGNDVVLTLATPPQSWRYTYFGTVTNTGTAADSFDANGDGETNFFEYATGQAPNANTTSQGVAALNGENFEYTYTRSLAAMADGFTFATEWSDTLAPDSWSGAGVSEVVPPISDDGIVQTVKMIVPAGAGPRRFIHLKVTKP